MMSLEAATRGMGIKGSPAGFTVAAFSYKEMHYVDVLLLPFLKMVWWGPRTGQIPEGFPITAARAQLGVGSKELGNQSSVTVIFMGTLTNLCAWDQTTISKNISKYSFALFCFGKNYSCSCCHLTWKQHMEQLQQLHFVTFSNVSTVTGQMDQWLKWKQRRSK